MKPTLIVVHPVSFTPSGRTALMTADTLARLSGGDLHLLDIGGRRRAQEDAAIRLPGDMVEAVVGYAKSTSADLVVVADRARSHGPYSRRGRYARDLARRLSIPVLSVQASEDVAAIPKVPFTSIFCAVDPSPSAVAAVERAVSLVRHGGAKVTRLRADGALSGESIVKAATEAEADLIVIGGPGTDRRLAMKSALAHVLRHATASLLILPAAAAGVRNETGDLVPVQNRTRMPPLIVRPSTGAHAK